MLTRCSAAILMILAAGSAALAQSSSAPFAAALANEQVIRLWDGNAPGQNGQTNRDIPALTVYLPPEGKATGAAFLCCPGGGYQMLTPTEAAPVGRWMAERGVTAFVLRYRLGPKYSYPCQLDDAQRAIRTVRANAAAWKLDANRIGVIGFSAGGHLASTLCTHFAKAEPNSPDPVNRVSSQPNLAILVYPVITFGQGTHAGSRNYFLGKNQTQEMIDLFSNEKQVSKDTPKTFLVHSIPDPLVPVANSDNYVEALKKAGVEYEYLRLESGFHGYGLTNTWTPQCTKWLVKNGYARE
jgi:acetyl esterase/lipase